MELLQLGHRYSQEIVVVVLITRKVGLTPNATISVLSPRRNTSLLGDLLYCRIGTLFRGFVKRFRCSKIEPP